MGHRRKHKHAGGHHGGSWKVAYADFVTAMMAFFLLLWLLNMTSDEQKAKLSHHFKYFSIFDKGKGAAVGVSKEDSASDFSVLGSDDNALKKDKPISSAYEQSETDRVKQEVQQRLSSTIEVKLADVKAQILVDAIPEGIRIQMVDNEGYLLFPVGESSMTPKAKEILRVVTDAIRDVPANVVIEGHTDARPYPSEEFTNWELSADRANAARREMVQDGLKIESLMRVTGNADRNPLIPENPLDPRNRRISILLYIADKQAVAPIIKAIPSLMPQ